MFDALKRYIPWLISSTLAISLILSNDSPQIKKIRSNYTDLVVVVTRPLGAIIRLPGVWRENRKLHKQLAMMSLLLAQRVDSGNEAARLREMLKLSDRIEYDLIAAEVISLSSDQSVRGIVIDRGITHGVAENQAVIASEGLIGKVYSVGEKSSQVQLMLDPNFGVAGRLLKSQEECIVRPGVKDKLILNGIPSTAEVSIGDSVITSGLGGVYPPGLFIGRTKKIDASQDDWLLEVEVETDVEFTRISEVFVVRERPKSE